MDQQRNRRNGGLPGLLIPLVVLVASVPVAAAPRYHLTRVSSCGALRESLVDQIVEQVLNRSAYYGYRWRSGRSLEAAPAARKSMAAPAGDGAGGEKAGPSHYTGTNNQVVGVDEADLVKTDGRFIYTLHGGEVLIIKSWPATSTSIVARYKVTGGSPTQLFVNGDKLVVFSSAQAVGRGYRPSFGASRITLLDISDRTDPRLVANVDVEGSLLRARMIGSDIYLVTNSGLQLPQSFWDEVIRPPQARPFEERPYYRYRRYPYPVYGSPMSREEARLRVRRALGRVSVEQLLPSVAFSYGGAQQPTQRPLLSCSDVYAPAGPASTLGLITLSHFSLSGGRVHASAVVGNGMHIYASESAVYVAATNYRWDSGEQGTQIHKFDLQRFQGAPRYAASGVVPGHLLNQFSMDEHRGHLRVATTDSGWRGSWRWRGREVSGAASNVTVLQQRQGELATAGQVRGLAPGERIFAARMMGDHGYVVTFRQTDPLFTLDLSQPSRPRVVGELKIPGFSSYIHPIGGGRLLTVGQDADESGRVQGAHLQIFDVSDLRNPRRTHHYKLTMGASTSSSLAQWDHHAFTFDSRSRTLALPLSVYNYQKAGSNFAGVILVRVDAEKGFVNLGDVEHSDLAFRAACTVGGTCPNATRAQYWNAPVLRSIFMEDVLYTLSGHGLKVSQLPKLSTVAALTFAPGARQAFLR